MNNELNLMRAAADILKQQGEACTPYITAELEPYSAQQKPDVSFVPNQGPNAGKDFLVEFRLFESGELPPAYVDVLEEHRAFALEGVEADCGGFAFATNAKLGRVSIQRLTEASIRYLGPVDSAQALADQIDAWAAEAGDHRP